MIRNFRTAFRSKCHVSRRLDLRKFAHDESGAMVIFAVYMFLMMLLVAGIGVDLMRFESNRTKLQYTLDRAVLAAADLDQPLSPDAVVRDYFDKAGLSNYLSSVTVNEGLNYRVVSATASAEVKTQFMHMTGIDTLQATGASQAEERIDAVEISLVLDVSGSMNSNSRLYNLKIAAKDFIDEMLDNSEAGKVSISIIPYATQVSVAQDFWNQLNTTDEHNYSRCINFAASDFNSASISLVDEYERTMHFDPWDDFDGRDNDPVELVRRPVCEEDSSREMKVLQSNRTELKSYINNLYATGNTSIDIGMKWGTALLDASIAPAITAMIADGDVPADFAARPAAYNDNETIKVIVLMTDGQNTSQYYINDGFRSGESNIWWNEQEEIYSVYVGLDDEDEDNDGITEEPLFYWPHDNVWRDHAYGEGTFEETQNERVCKSYKRNGSCRKYRTVKTTVTVNEPGSAEYVSYPDLWAYTSMEWNVEDNYQPWMNNDQAWNDWYYDVRNYVGSSTKNSRTRAVCDAAKAQKIIVFSIGFEAPSSGEAILQDCASSPSHFFDVNGLEISDAFSAIASSIRALRLTQ